MEPTVILRFENQVHHHLGGVVLSSMSFKLCAVVCFSLLDAISGSASFWSKRVLGD